jgi:hypothetical protein
VLNTVGLGPGLVAHNPLERHLGLDVHPEMHQTPYFSALSTVVASVADPDPGSGAFLTPGSGMVGKKSGPGSGMNHPDHISESLETIFLD